MPIDPLASSRPSRPAGPQPPRKELPTAADTRPVRLAARRKRAFLPLLWAAVLALYLAAGGAVGALAAYSSATRTLNERRQEQALLVLTEQYFLGLQDVEAGRYEIARHRFEFVLARDPAYPGAAEKLAEVERVLFATATPTHTPTTTATPTATVTPSPSPTPDLRPLQELLAQAEADLAAGDWSKAIDALSALRSADAAYAVARVDGMLFLALRNRGVDRILAQKDLEGGAYDLSLAERFGPLDSKASWARQMARLYVYGSAFWEAYPEQAVFYFGQVASAAPYLTDASGWTAMERYRASLIHYGNALAAKDEWCEAQAQYELALSIRGDEDLQATAEEAAYRCSPPTATPTETPTFTLTPTATPAPSATLPPEPPTATLEPPPPATDTPPPPTDTPPAPPSDTPLPPETPTPTLGAPEPSPTPTAEPPTAAPPTATPTETPTLAPAAASGAPLDLDPGAAAQTGLAGAAMRTPPTAPPRGGDSSTLGRNGHG